MKIEIQKRFKQLLLDIIFGIRKLPRADEFNIISKQVIRSSSSAAANYRAACRAKSKADLVYKLKIVEEEIDETNFWLEILKEVNSNSTMFTRQLDESSQLTAIIVSSIKTLKKNNHQ